MSMEPQTFMCYVLYVHVVLSLECASVVLCHATFCIINLKWWHLLSVQNECKAVFQERVKRCRVSGKDAWGVVCLKRRSFGGANIINMLHVLFFSEDNNVYVISLLYC